MADLGRKGMLRGASGVHPQGSLPGQEGSSWARCRVQEVVPHVPIQSVGSTTLDQGVQYPYI